MDLSLWLWWIGDTSWKSPKKYDWLRKHHLYNQPLAGVIIPFGTVKGPAIFFLPWKVIENSDDIVCNSIHFFVASEVSGKVEGSPCPITWMIFTLELTLISDIQVNFRRARKNHWGGGALFWFAAWSNSLRCCRPLHSHVHWSRHAQWNHLEPTPGLNHYRTVWGIDPMTSHDKNHPKSQYIYIKITLYIHLNPIHAPFSSFGCAEKPWGGDRLDRATNGGGWDKDARQFIFTLLVCHLSGVVEV